MSFLAKNSSVLLPKISLSRPLILPVVEAVGAAALYADYAGYDDYSLAMSAFTLASALAANSYLYEECGAASWSGFPSLYMFFAS